MATMKERYHWEHMHQDVYDFIHSCDRCQRIKKDQHIQPPPLTSMPIDGPFERWHIDFLKLSKTKQDKYEGPFYITKIGPTYTFKLRRLSDHQELKSEVYASRLEHYSNPRNHRAEKPGEGLEKLNASDRKTENNAKSNDSQTAEEQDLPAKEGYQLNEKQNHNQNLSQNIKDSNNDELIDLVNENEIYYPEDKLIKLNKRNGISHFYFKWLDGSKTWEPKQILP
ncbi:unnamed protein product [Mytilus coruscus]|uniref:Integrase zinc-binding domain-containing protein n=1 Tax=Mytilus coruscus TaxID=42192 RepID=A0A6J8CUA0_MYTCO|nr:unnamed protein product [Mytilus coruscus]